MAIIPKTEIDRIKNDLSSGLNRMYSTYTEMIAFIHPYVLLGKRSSEQHVAEKSNDLLYRFQRLSRIYGEMITKISSLTTDSEDNSEPVIDVSPVLSDNIKSLIEYYYSDSREISVLDNVMFWEVIDEMKKLVTDEFSDIENIVVGATHALYDNMVQYDNMGYPIYEVFNSTMTMYSKLITACSRDVLSIITVLESKDELLETLIAHNTKLAYELDPNKIRLDSSHVDVYTKHQEKNIYIYDSDKDTLVALTDIAGDYITRNDAITYLVGDTAAYTAAYTDMSGSWTGSQNSITSGLYHSYDTAGSAKTYLLFGDKTDIDEIIVQLQEQLAAILASIRTTANTVDPNISYYDYANRLKSRLSALKNTTYLQTSKSLKESTITNAYLAHPHSEYGIKEISKGSNYNFVADFLKKVRPHVSQRFFLKIDRQYMSLSNNTYIHSMTDLQKLVLIHNAVNSDNIIDLNSDRIQEIRSEFNSLINNVITRNNVSSREIDDIISAYGILIDEKSVLINRIMYTNPTENYNRKLEFLRHGYNENDIESVIEKYDDNDIYSFDEVIKRDPLWTANESDVLSHDFNMIKTKYYEIDSSITDNYVAMKTALFINMLKELRTTAYAGMPIENNPTDITAIISPLQFIQSEMNGNRPIYLFDAIISLTILNNRFMGVTYDKIYDGFDIQYVYGYNNPGLPFLSGHISGFDALHRDNSNIIAVYMSPSTFKCNPDTLHVGDYIRPKSGTYVYTKIIKIEHDDSVPNNSIITIDGSYINFGIKSIMKYRTDVDTSLYGGSALNDDIESIGPSSFVTTNIRALKKILDDTPIALRPQKVYDFFNDEVIGLKEQIQRLFPKIQNHDEYRKLSDYYTSMYYNYTYTKEIFRKPTTGYYDDTLDYFSNNPNYSAFTSWLKAEEVENLKLKTFDERREIYRSKIMGMISAINLYITDSNIDALFNSSNYLYHIRKMIYVVLKYFKSYTMDVLPVDTTFIMDDFFENNVRIFDKQKITDIFNIYEPINNVILDDSISSKSNYKL